MSNSKRTADEWTFHSFCSAHLEEAHQWGAGLGLEDDTFLTVEEWTSLDAVRRLPHTPEITCRLALCACDGFQNQPDGSTEKTEHASE